MRYFYLCILSLFFFSCRTFFSQPSSVQKARIGESNPGMRDFKNLPKPKEKIAAAVYKFRDQTGQYKASDLGANWSTAIPQGTTSMLLKSLEDSGWFLSVERENVSNLMNERKIIRSSMAQYQNNADPLPAMLFAGVILEGGIVSYDANVITGGSGLRYFGSGGSTQYRQDRFTVYLRAVASKTGQVLKTVYTSKTILSQSVSAGVFRYVSLSHILEGEVGLTTNEPVQIALQEAIDKSVHMLIVEGLKDKLWLCDESEKEKENTSIANYDLEMQQNLTQDVYGITELYDQKGLSISPLINFSSLATDYSRSNNFGFGLGVNYKYSDKNELQFSIIPNRFRVLQGRNSFIQLNLVNNWSFQPNQRLNVTAGGGFGFIYSSKSNNVTLGSIGFKPHLIGNMGMEYFINKRLSLRLSSSFLWNLTDDIDGLKYGKYNDNLWSNSVGVNYFLRVKK